MLDYMRRKRMLPEGMYLDHRPGPSDALLWAADAVCGAVVRARDGQTRYIEVIGSKLKIISIDADS